MKQRVLLFFLFVLFCLGLVGCAAVYPQEELVVKGGFDGAYYIYSDKVNVYLRYSGKEDYLIIKTSENEAGWESSGYKVISGEFSEAAYHHKQLFIHCGNDYYAFDIEGYSVGNTDEEGSPEYSLKKYADSDFKKSFPDYKSFDWYDH